MKVEELVERYIHNTKQAFQQIRNNRSLGHDAEEILDYAKRYLEDAMYYRDQKRFETALASVAYCEGLLDALKRYYSCHVQADKMRVAYCEGLLDALKLLRMVEFQWQRESK